MAMTMTCYVIYFAVSEKNETSWITEWVAGVESAAWLQTFSLRWLATAGDGAGVLFLLLRLERTGEDVLEVVLMFCPDLSVIAAAGVVAVAAVAVALMWLLLLWRERPFSWRSVGVSGLLELLFEDGGVIVWFIIRLWSAKQRKKKRRKLLTKAVGSRNRDSLIVTYLSFIFGSTHYNYGIFLTFKHPTAGKGMHVKFIFERCLISWQIIEVNKKKQQIQHQSPNVVNFRIYLCFH